jgi:hypothetical protein
MVQLIPPSAHAPGNANANPTRADIDAFIHGGYGSAAADAATLRGIVREIECKSGAGALLHPAEEYFVAAANYSIVLSCKER